LALKDRTGSSQVAIQKYILASFPEVDAKKLKQHLLKSLKVGVANKRFLKIKALYKIHPNAKKTPQKEEGEATAASKKEKTHYVYINCNSNLVFIGRYLQN
jgi:ssDNA-binding Zn-finger/Zn-ribbon topoisomerase 1